MLKPSAITNELLNSDPIWHVQFVVIVAMVLQLVLPDDFVVGPKELLPILEGLLVVFLFFTSRNIKLVKLLFRKFNSVSLIVLIAAANVYALQRLAHVLLVGGRITDGHSLILTAINIFFTNMIIFGLLYWEIDGGGPVKRRRYTTSVRDFAFPQMTSPDLAPHGWMPNFIDYLYLSLTNATAFSPTDTMPMSRRAKLIMGVQSLISLTTIALVASRAVNILK